MATYQFYIYNTDALAYNSSTGRFELDAGYTHANGRHLVVVNDDDANANPSGDSNQTATVYDTQGNVVTSGVMTVPAYASVSGPSGTIYLDRFEVNGTHVGYASSEVLSPGSSYPVTGSSSAAVPYSYFESNSINCFVDGTQIETDDGSKAVECLKAGDLVVTKDAGLRPVVHRFETIVTAARMAVDAAQAPVTLWPGSLGPDVPIEPLCVSRDHRVLVNGADVELLFGSSEVLGPAAGFVARNRSDIRAVRDVRYHHILLAEHHLLRANGAWVESFFPGPEAMRRLGPDGRQTVMSISETMRAARPCLTVRETRAVLRLQAAREKGVGGWRQETGVGRSKSFDRATPSFVG